MSIPNLTAMFQRDEIGVPSTLGAILFNLINISGVEVVNHIFTWSVSVLSIIYLIYKIKNERGRENNK